MPSPTQRSLKHIREKGYNAEITEKFNVWSKTRHDTWNMFDILYFGNQEIGVVGVQTTSGSNVSARIHKLQANPLLKEWTDCGNACYVHGWRKVGKQGKRKLWELREILVTP